MMMGFGFLLMLVVLAVPILLIANLILLAVKPNALKDGQLPPTVGSMPVVTPAAGACSHCGAKLQAEWVHCPQCGAPV